MRQDPNYDRLDRLFAAARKSEFYNKDVESGFEARVAAKIRARREGRSPFFFWAWRLIPVFVSIIVFLGIWLFASQPSQQIDLSAISNVGSEETMLTAYLTGE